MTAEALPVQHRHTPLRTCVGCQGRDEQSQLLRVVGVGPGTSPQDLTTLSPDPARRAGARGAYVHRDPACVQSALRRRAFGRALRLNGRVETEQLVRWTEKYLA